MNYGITRTVIDVCNISSREKEILADDLYALYEELFYGWSKDTLKKLIFGWADVFCKVAFFSLDTRVIGFALLKAAGIPFRGRHIVVFTTAGGIVKEHRKNGLITSFFRNELLWYRFMHPLKTIYTVQRLIHPASYLAWIRALREMYPHPHLATPRYVSDLVAFLNASIPYRQIDPDDPFVVVRDNHARESDQDSESWQRRNDPAIRLYYQMTGRGDDRAIVMIFPCTYKNLFLSFVKITAKMVRRFTVE